MCFFLLGGQNLKGTLVKETNAEIYLIIFICVSVLE